MSNRKEMDRQLLQSLGSSTNEFQVPNLFQQHYVKSKRLYTGAKTKTTLKKEEQAVNLWSQEPRESISGLRNLCGLRILVAW